MIPHTIPVPDGHNTVNPFVIVPDADGFIAFVSAVFDGRENTQVRTPDRDGSLIHAEVTVGTSTIMLCDRKADWPFTPALLQVYAADAQRCLDLAVARGGRVVTPVSDFYGGYRLARLLDPWHNLWWIYSPTANPTPQADRDATTDWHDREPSLVYTSLMQTMRELADPAAATHTRRETPA